MTVKKSLMRVKQMPAPIRAWGFFARALFAKNNLSQASAGR